MAAESNVPPLVLLIEPSVAQHHHADLLTRARFRVEELPPHAVTTERIDEMGPAIIAVELDESNPSDALELTPRLRGSVRSRLTGSEVRLGPGFRTR